MVRIATPWKSLGTQAREHRAQLGLSLRVTIAALLSFVLSHLLHVPLPLWTVLTAVILTQVSFGKSLKATIDYLVGTLGGAVYAGTKAFVRQFSLDLRCDLHGTGVRVTSIEPGMAETEFTIVRTGGDKEASDKLYAGVNPLTAEDHADVFWWIANLPPHININTLELMPVNQSFAGFAVHREG